MKSGEYCGICELMAGKLEEYVKDNSTEVILITVIIITCLYVIDNFIEVILFIILINIYI